MKISIPVNEEYEIQVKIPKPILMDIFQRCGLENLMKISLISKQFYFLLKSDNFWMKMLKTTDLNEIEIDSMRKTQSLVEIYRDTLCGWDFKASNKNRYIFKGNTVIHNEKNGLATVVSKKKFFLGEEILLFTFELKAKKHLNATGVCIENW